MPPHGCLFVRVYVCDMQKRRLFSVLVSFGMEQMSQRVQGDAVVFTSLGMAVNCGFFFKLSAGSRFVSA